MRLALALVLLLAGPVLADPAQAIDSLAFMAGDWAQQDGDVQTRETWLPAKGGVMAGVTQTYRPGKPTEVEFARITARPEGLVFTALPAGQPPTDFRQIPDAKGRAVFENPAHDFPQRVIYWRCEGDLCARIEGTMDGKAMSLEWRYRRQP
ncbi:hypothetical protein QO010_002580 [Caulobacter ginsengisoli]|uniref:DUF6265 domain-containing protein n=1 Tax=Caulobacter ginsengisoli TaxID=400775 RepID=A0ABU0IS11_9CAUL|nr:DUF6265 family protein [Caulobacter ginsengisoli]MDQ0464796.1 hypothetical protein [Caulobacter ginsengisoli]